jgi:hypothetical protein
MDEKAIKDLFYMNGNYLGDTGPWVLFLDIIGVNEEPVYDWSARAIGYLEAEALGAALVAHAAIGWDRTQAILDQLETMS